MFSINLDGIIIVVDVSQFFSIEIVSD